MAGHNPHPCSCFGGYCWKNLCAVRTVNREIAKREPPPDHESFLALQKACNKSLKPYIEKRKRPEIRTWRFDGSHELGPVPEGRIPLLPEA